MGDSSKTQKGQFGMPRTIGWGDARVGLLLGAGASQPLGLPMMLDLLPVGFRDQLTVTDERNVFDLAANWALAQGPKEIDFEFLYTAVDAMARMQADDLLGLAFAPHQQGRGMLFKVGGDRFELRLDGVRANAQSLLTKLKVMVHDRLGTVDPERSAAVFLPVFDLVFEAAGQYLFIDCYTTNYDRAIEAIWDSTVFERREVPLELERGFRQVNPNRGMELDIALFGETAGNDQRGPATVNLIKLHGGLNWIRDGERVMESPTTDYVRRNSLIYPLRKTALEPPFSGLLERFKRGLAELDLLVVVGNSLRDPHIREAITDEVRRRTQGLKIVVMAPNARELLGGFDDDVQPAILPAVGYLGQSAALDELRDRIQEGLRRPSE